MDNINSLDQVAQVLEQNGYAVQLEEDAVYTGVGGSENPFTAVLSINDTTRQLLINCQLATLGDLEEEVLTATALAALDANTRVCPYAYAIISEADDPDLDNEQKWPLVLTDSMPLGGLSDDELMANIDSLWQAIAASREVLEIGLGK